MGWAPLHFAVYLNNKELVIFFIEKGADVNKFTLDDKWNPL